MTINIQINKFKVLMNQKKEVDLHCTDNYQSELKFILYTNFSTNNKGEKLDFYCRSIFQEDIINEIRRNYRCKYYLEEISWQKEHKKIINRLIKKGICDKPYTDKQYKALFSYF